MRSFALILLVFVFFACAKENSFDSYNSLKEGLINIKVEDLNFRKSIVIDSIFNINKIVKLESNEDSFIGSYDKILIDEDRIFIMDSSISFSIFVFDFSGNFLFKIFSFGEGPDEYLELRDFTLSSANNTIDILDFGGKKILSFSKENGELLDVKYIDVNTYFRSFERIGNGYIFSHANTCGFIEDCFNVSFWSDDLILESRSFEMNEYLKGYDFKGDPQFSRSYDRVFYKEIFSDTIYEVQQDSKQLRTAFSIDFGKFRLPDDFKYSRKNSNLAEALQYSLNENMTLGIKDFFVSDQYLYFTYGTPGLREVLIDLKTLDNVSFQRYITSNFLYTGTVRAIHKNQLVKVISSEEIISIVSKFYNTKDSLKIRQEYNEFYTLAKDIDSGSNGLITFLDPDF
ncbi:6-bladed beta-propeller [Algoriphagus sp. CAU 1675]|uniref:6-bladed beta-propeller n=1 Tax=Algoriphagus sp. CAU 1675 TaxID=3032597 RepID=UPI0023DAE2DB|nr:6-bladed beta-propeller [Algoriphagus sp. CAU 1675]MDF2156759.1 6-bladed beta-propeller [Algoriphagus sp. CAU 1675]